MKMITSAQNEKIKRIQSLYKRKNREASKMFLAEGVRLAEMALAAKEDIVYAFLQAGAAEADKRLAGVVGELIRCDVDLYEVSANLFQKLTATVTSQGILLVVRERGSTLDEVGGRGGVPFWVVLDGVQDPGNAGSILRTAEAAGATGVIFLRGSVDAYSDKVVRASMGAVFTIPIVTHVKRGTFSTYCRKNGIRLYASFLDPDALSYTEMECGGAIALVLGNEGAGASSEIASAADARIYIPMYGKSESLNVAAAGAILCYRVAEMRASTI